MHNRRETLRLGLAAAGMLFGQTSVVARSGAENNSGITMLEAQITRDLQAWDNITLHRTATPGDNETAQWLAQEISQAGVSPSIEKFAFKQRLPGKCEVFDGTHSALGLPMFDGGSTTAQGITHVCGNLGSNAPIAITRYGSNARDAQTQNLEAARRESRHKAIVAIADVVPNEPGLAVLNAESYREPYGPPVIQLASGEATWLIEAAEERRTITVHAELIDKQTYASNVSAVVQGRSPQLAPVVVMTPRSGWWTCTSERGGGITLWLNCLRHFALTQPLRNVIFTANTGHELSHIGLDYYLDQNPELIQGAHAWVHLGANFAARGGRVLWQASTQAYLDAGMAQLRTLGVNDVVAQPVDQRPLGEARSIYDGQGQFISLLGGNPLFHHPDDRWPEAVDLGKTVLLNQMMLRVVNELANQI